RSLRTTLDPASLYQIAIGAASNVLSNTWCAILSFDSESETFVAEAVRAFRPDDLPPPPVTAGQRLPAAGSDLADAARSCEQVITPDLAASSGERERDLVAQGYRSRAVVPIMVENVCAGVLASYSPAPKGHSRDTVG